MKTSGECVTLLSRYLKTLKLQKCYNGAGCFNNWLHEYWKQYCGVICYNTNTKWQQKKDYVPHWTFLLRKGTEFWWSTENLLHHYTPVFLWAYITIARSVLKMCISFHLISSAVLMCFNLPFLYCNYIGIHCTCFTVPLLPHTCPAYEFVIHSVAWKCGAEFPWWPDLGTHLYRTNGKRNRFQRCKLGNQLWFPSKCYIIHSSYW